MSNSTTVTGNLTREPEIRYTREGHAATVLGVAVSRRWENRETREWEESTSFFEVVCWRDLAENAALSLVKGMRVMVTGRLEQRTWETEDGERRSKVEIVAEEIGPSLRFATAEVQRSERRTPGRATSSGGAGASGPGGAGGGTGGSPGTGGDPADDPGEGEDDGEGGTSGDAAGTVAAGA